MHMLDICQSPGYSVDVNIWREKLFDCTLIFIAGVITFFIIKRVHKMMQHKKSEELFDTIEDKIDELATLLMHLDTQDILRATKNLNKAILLKRQDIISKRDSVKGSKIQ